MTYPREHVDIAIVTVSTNKLDEACLKSVHQLLNQTSLKVKFIVVDNASTAFDAHSYVKQHVPEAIVILRDNNPGFGASCNRGACEIDADYYFFLNPDTRIDDLTAIDRLHTFFETVPSRSGSSLPKFSTWTGGCRKPVAGSRPGIHRWLSAHRSWTRKSAGPPRRFPDGGLCTPQTTPCRLGARFRLHDRRQIIPRARRFRRTLLHVLRRRGPLSPVLGAWPAGVLLA